jgi:hypothetical protein
VVQWAGQAGPWLTRVAIWVRGWVGSHQHGGELGYDCWASLGCAGVEKQSGKLVWGGLCKKVKKRREREIDGWAGVLAQGA